MNKYMFAFYRTGEGMLSHKAKVYSLRQANCKVRASMHRAAYQDKAREILSLIAFESKRFIEEFEKCSDRYIKERILTIFDTLLKHVQTIANKSTLKIEFLANMMGVTQALCAYTKTLDKEDRDDSSKE